MKSRCFSVGFLFISKILMIDAVKSLDEVSFCISSWAAEIEQWKNYGFSIDLIRYAYEKTVERIDKLSFDYINKILLSWRDSGFTTVQEVHNAESDYNRQKKSSASKKGNDDSDFEKYESVINKFLY